MEIPYWHWRIRYRTSDGGCETGVVAPHPAGAKQAITAFISTPIEFDAIESQDRVPADDAGRHFAGYYPRFRVAIDAWHTAILDFWTRFA